MMVHMDPVPQHHPGEYVPRAQLSQGYPQRISCHPASEGREWRLPELTPACGQGKRCGPGQLSGALVGSKLVSGFGWKRPVVRDAAAEGMGFGKWWAWKGSPQSRNVKREFYMGVDGKDGKLKVLCREISNT